MHQLELTQRILRLRTVLVFRSMAATDLARVASSMKPRVFDKGAVILREEEPLRAFHLILSGVVTMTRKGELLGTVRAPGAVGFLSLLARSAGGTTAVAESFTETYELRTETVDEIFEDHFDVLLGSVRWLAERVVAENIEQTPPAYVPSPAANISELVTERELGIVERIFLLRRMRTFTGANVNSLAAFARRLEEVRVGAGEVLWRPGDPADHSYIVVKGLLKLVWKDGRVAQTLGPGYVVGGGESLVGRPRWNELVTTEPCVLLRGSPEALVDAFEDDHELATRFLSMFATLLIQIWDDKARAGIVSIGSAGAGAATPEAAPRP